MKKNIHSYERALRVVAGIALCSLAFFGPENLWYLAGLIPLITGLVGWCPPYQLLGYSSCPMKKK